MSGSFPTSPAASSVTFKSIEPTLVSVAQNLKRQVRRRGGQRWQLDIEFPPMTRSEFAPIYAFAMSQKGQFETFTYIPPVISTSQGDTTESPLIDGQVSVGASSAIISLNSKPSTTINDAPSLSAASTFSRRATAEVLSYV